MPLEEAEEDSAPADLVQSATSAERLATSLAPALRLPPVLEETMARSVETRRLGKIDHFCER